MSDKLKFKDEVIDEGEPAEKSFNGKFVIESAPDPPTDIDITADEPAVESDGGGELPDVDVSDDNPEDNPIDTDISEVEPVETTSKLYERDSSLKFDEEDKTAEPPKEIVDGKSKKYRKPFGITGDTTSTHDSGNKKISEANTDIPIDDSNVIYDDIYNKREKKTDNDVSEKKSVADDVVVPPVVVVTADVITKVIREDNEKTPDKDSTADKPDVEFDGNNKKISEIETDITYGKADVIYNDEKEKLEKSDDDSDNKTAVDDVVLPPIVAVAATNVVTTVIREDGGETSDKDTKADTPIVDSGDSDSTHTSTKNPTNEPNGGDSIDTENADTETAADVHADPDKKPTKEEIQSKKRDKKISKLEHKTDKYGAKRDKAKSKQPTRKKKVKERYFDEEKGKAKTKLRFEEEIIPINEAKWNVPKKQSLPVKGAAALTTAGVNKLHSKIYEVENENVGTKSAHRAELIGESAARGGKKLIHETYRHVKNTPYRKAAKFEAKEIKTRMKLDYQKVLKDNPKLQSNPLSRFMQKRKIKKQYADALRKAKKSGETLKKTGSVVTKVTQTVTKIVRRNPIFLLKAGLLLLIIFAIMSLLSMCMSIFSGGGAGVFGAACYAADDGDIEKAELSYTEWETDLRLEILNAETTQYGYDEYRYNIGNIGHDPHILMSYLTAVYQKFTYAGIENALKSIFNQQYTLAYIPEIEIRWTEAIPCTDPPTTDPETEELIYCDCGGTPPQPYEWHILNVNLTSVPLPNIVTPLMSAEQMEQFTLLAQTKGGRQYGASPFDVINWLSSVTSPYGYRIHPITGVKDLYRGIDIVMPEGTEIHAGITGTVTAATYDSSFGNYIVIKSADGIEMKYAHCQTLLFSVGQTVTKGDVIAKVGNTGDSTGAHLHMEILKNSIYLNPIYFVETYY